ncbi:hypothetical protein HYALB_00005362 [Hymenoscyphus albidus]|uniref:Uncharacterized protein n=1 Tax=Hymenoscyphus albidus TaxID=595503 RepID=A0A9N9LEG3_9HELO|nr:hypothetical protein HYALB_00005362 [Hymenoscyphus albidus]
MLRGRGPKPVPSSSSSSSPTKQTKTTKTTMKLFRADEPFAAISPRPQGLAKDSKKSGWKEGIVTLNPRTTQEYKVFVQWGVTVPGPVYKEFVERVCAQAAREHDHGFVLIRSCLHATSRAGTKPTVNNGKPVPAYKRDDPHITAGFGPPLSSPRPTEFKPSPPMSTVATHPPHTAVLPVVPQRVKMIIP